MRIYIYSLSTPYSSTFPRLYDAGGSREYGVAAGLVFFSFLPFFSVFIYSIPRGVSHRLMALFFFRSCLSSFSHVPSSILADISDLDTTPCYVSYHLYTHQPASRATEFRSRNFAMFALGYADEFWTTGFTLLKRTMAGFPLCPATHVFELGTAQNQLCMTDGQLEDRVVCSAFLLYYIYVLDALG